MAGYKPVKLAYKVFEPTCGSDDRLSPLIFLHGLGSTKDATWYDLPQIFADQTKRKAYSLDARNHGDSEWSDEFDFDLNAEDLLHFINEQGFSKVIIVGHSMGGITGIKAALRAPEKIEMLIVEDQYVKRVPQFSMNSVSKIISMWKESEMFISPDMDKKCADNFITEYVLSKLDLGDNPNCNTVNLSDLSYPLVKDSSGRYFFNVNLKVILEKTRNVETLMAENEGSYDGPSCFVYGIASPLQVGNEKHHILKHFPKAIFEPFDTSKHVIHKEFSDLFVKTVVNFIKQNENSQGRRKDIKVDS